MVGMCCGNICDSLKMYNFAFCRVRSAMEEQREQRRVVLRLPAVEEASQRWEETFRRDDFNELERFGVEDVELRVGVTASFAEFHYVVRMDGQGRVQLACDRCLRPMWVPIEFHELLLVSRGERLALEGEEWEVPYEQEEVDLMPFVEESLYLYLPMRRYHGMDGTNAEDCDAEMLSYIKEGEYRGEMGLDEDSLAKLALLRKRVERNE